MKEGDIGVELTFNIKDENEEVVEFTNIDKATLYMRFKGETEVNDVDLTVEGPFKIIENGVMQYVTQKDDLFMPGTLEMEITLTFLGGEVYTTTTMKVKVKDAISV